MKILILSWLLLFVMGYSGSSFAIGGVSIGGHTGSVVEQAVGKGVEEGVKNDVNKYLSKQSCKCNTTTYEVTGCNTDEIASYVGKRNDSLKAIFGRNIRFNVKSSRWSCSEKIINKLRSSYSYWTYPRHEWSGDSSSTEMKLSVD